MQENKNNELFKQLTELVTKYLIPAAQALERATSKKSHAIFSSEISMMFEHLEKMHASNKYKIISIKYPASHVSHSLIIFFYTHQKNPNNKNELTERALKHFLTIYFFLYGDMNSLEFLRINKIGFQAIMDSNRKSSDNIGDKMEEEEEEEEENDISEKEPAEDENLFCLYLRIIIECHLRQISISINKKLIFNLFEQAAKREKIDYLKQLLIFTQDECSLDYFSKDIFSLIEYKKSDDKSGIYQDLVALSGFLIIMIKYVFKNDDRIASQHDSDHPVAMFNLLLKLIKPYSISDRMEQAISKVIRDNQLKPDHKTQIFILNLMAMCNVSSDNFIKVLKILAASQENSSEPLAIHLINLFRSDSVKKELAKKIRDTFPNPDNKVSKCLIISLNVNQVDSYKTLTHLLLIFLLSQKSLDTEIIQLILPLLDQTGAQILLIQKLEHTIQNNEELAQIKKIIDLLFHLSSHILVIKEVIKLLAENPKNVQAKHTLRIIQTKSGKESLAVLFIEAFGNDKIDYVEMRFFISMLEDSKDRVDITLRKALSIKYNHFVAISTIDSLIAPLKNIDINLPSFAKDSCAKPAFKKTKKNISNQSVSLLIAILLIIAYSEEHENLRDILLKETTLPAEKEIAATKNQLTNFNQILELFPEHLLYESVGFFGRFHELSKSVKTANKRSHPSDSGTPLLATKIAELEYLISDDNIGNIRKFQNLVEELKRYASKLKDLVNSFFKDGVFLAGDIKSKLNQISAITDLIDFIATAWNFDEKFSLNECLSYYIKHSKLGNSDVAEIMNLLNTSTTNSVVIRRLGQDVSIAIVDNSDEEETSKNISVFELFLQKLFQELARTMPVFEILIEAEKEMAASLGLNIPHLEGVERACRIAPGS